jgi:hypothetical protein
VLLSLTTQQEKFRLSSPRDACLAAALVLTPGTPLGLLTNLVQTLAGVLLPSATVFLLLLCDRAVLGPWVNSRRVTFFTARVIAWLVMLSVILTASTFFPDITEAQIIGVRVGGSVLALAMAIGASRYERRRVLAR